MSIRTTDAHLGGANETHRDALKESPRKDWLADISQPQLISKSAYTSPDASYAPCQLEIFLHDGNTLCMDCTEIRVLEEMNKKRF
jgi:hypothetical protein